MVNAFRTYQAWVPSTKNEIKIRSKEGEKEKERERGGEEGETDETQNAVLSYGKYFHTTQFPGPVEAITSSLWVIG